MIALLLSVFRIKRAWSITLYTLVFYYRSELSEEPYGNAVFLTQSSLLAKFHRSRPLLAASSNMALLISTNLGSMERSIHHAPRYVTPDLL